MIKDPAIKLFGKTITLPLDKLVYDVFDKNQSSSDTSSSDDCKDESGGDLVMSTQDVVLVDTENDSFSQETPKNDEPVDSNGSEEKTPSKPDKILPCPRCNSMETKFCYYNNYNISQPRHFCKKCQRYWTAGGSMRNVPVGSGRRKNKQTSIPNYRHSMASDAIQTGIHFPSLKPNGYLVFGSDRQFSDSMAACSLNPQNHGGSELCNSSAVKGVQGSSLPNPPWLQISPPAFVPSCFPVTFYPAAPYWGTGVPSSWNGQSVSPQSPSSDHSAGNTSRSSTLGKRSIDGTMLPSPALQKEEKRAADQCVIFPKTLRIDDPIDAAKSSFLSTLGIKNRKIDSIEGKKFFKTFQSKADMNGNINHSTMVLQANPAALSRALNFRETAKCD